VPMGEDEPEGKPPPVQDKVRLAIDELDMIGVSPLGDNEYEALVVDKATGRLHFVRKGQPVVIEETAVDVADVRKDYVTLLYREEEIKVL